MSWRVRILAFFLTPLVVFGLLEIGLRICGYRYEPWADDLWGRTFAELRQTEIYEPDPYLLWTVRPSSILDLEEYGFLKIRTNSHGLRGKELPGEKQPGEVRVLCLGDSVTFGCGSVDGETWPERMEEALQAAPEMEGRQVRVINGAVPGWTSVQGMRLLERLGHLEPDVIVFWFGLADAHEMRDLPDSAHRLPVEGAPLQLSVLWKLRVFQLVQRTVTSIRSVAAEGTRVSRAEFRANVKRLLDLERSGGPRVLFVREPECVSITLTQLETVVARAEQEGVDLVIGPHRLLKWVVPAPEGADLVGKCVIWRDRAAVRFEAMPGETDYDRVDLAKDLVDVRSDLEMLRELKRAFDGLVEGLPEDCLGYEALFGDTPPREVFSDNCHLSERGGRLAGRALAAAALRALRKEE